MVAADIKKIEAARKGDRNAFSELMQERKDNIYRLAYTYVKNENDAMDILQNTVYKVFISIKKLKNPEYFNTWLTRIAVNCCIDYLRKKNRISDNEAECAEPEDMEKIADSTDDLSHIASSIDIFNAINKLDANHRIIVILKYFQDLTLTQIAEILTCPVGTVKTRLNRALGILRLELKEDLQ